ncbi:MAG: leucyl aminopeptidase family protein, partial [Pseudomonadota bacterium]
MPLTFADNVAAKPLYVLEQDALAGWLETQDETVATWVKASGFSAGLGQHALLPDPNGEVRGALAGYGTAKTRSRGRFHLG